MTLLTAGPASSQLLRLLVSRRVNGYGPVPCPICLIGQRPGKEEVYRGRPFEGSQVRTEAYLSPDRKYRYWLLRVWDESRPLFCCIGQNPSKADEVTNDATIRKDLGFAARGGFGGLLKLNVAAIRATDPRDCWTAEAPIGPENSVEYLHQYLTKFQPELIVAAWGNMHKRFAEHCAAIKSQIPNLWCFGTTQSGSPRHTLMLPYTTKLIRFHGAP
jgi:hypothetical protein